MAILFLIAVAVLIFVAILFVVRAIMFKRKVINEFRRCNVVVDGKKGSGKDLLFSEVIYKRKEKYYSNIDYGHGGEVITCQDVSVSPNTYKDFIEGKNVVVDRRFAEGKDIYISDGGIFLPSYMDSVLYKQFPSFPIYYALSRHLANHNIHVNIQNFGRLWKGLREQADSFIHVHGTISVPFFLLIKATIYEDYASASEHVRPIKVRFFNKYSKAEADKYHAERGDIVQGWFVVPKRHIKYDSRYFEKVVYGDSPRIEV